MNKYPKQAIAYKKTVKGIKQTISLDAEFSSSENESSPLNLHPQFSRFKTTIINTDGTSPKFATANIPANKVAAIKSLTDYVMSTKINNSINNNQSSQQNNTNQLCYTQVISFGKFKGKTPAVALVEDSNCRNELLSHRDFLSQNVAKFPANQNQIDAINEAVTLFDKNELIATSSASAPQSEYVVYEENFKPLRSKIRDDGKVFVYSISIKCIFSQNYSWEFSISNFYAPVDTKENGTLNVHLNEIDKSSKIDLIYRMSDVEWLTMINYLDKLLTLYEHSIFENCWKKAIDLNFQNINENKKGTVATSPTIPQNTNFVYPPQNEAPKTTPVSPQTQNPNNTKPVITFGKFKGKTPEVVLQENPLSRNELIIHRDFLKNNIDKYPANQNLINAINQAVIAFDKRVS